MGSDVAERQRAVAADVRRFCSSSYGPGGGHKLVALEGGPVVLDSAASAFRESAGVDGWVAPYVALAKDVQRHAGDQGTASLFLAAALVERALDGPAPRAAYLAGYGLARRQALGSLASLAVEGPVQAPAIAPRLQASGAALVGGLLDRIHREGSFDLDDVELRASRVVAATWTDGIPCTPVHPPVATGEAPVGVAVLSGSIDPGSRHGGVVGRIDSPDSARAWQAQDLVWVRRWRDLLEQLRVKLLVVQGDIPEPLQDALHGRVQMWKDAPKDACRRIAAATGANPVHALGHLELADVGHAVLHVRRRPEPSLMIHGDHPGATFWLPATVASEQAASLDAAERLLRATGSWLADPRVVPGGGRWQRRLAKSLRNAADAAPGQTPFAVRVAADALDALASALVANQGADPVDTPLLQDAEEVTDVYACVRLAVGSAFDTAIQVLRVDGRHDKRPSSGRGLRGGGDRIGSPKGMPGDVPPLM